MTLDNFEINKSENCTIYHHLYEDITLIATNKSVDVWISGNFLFECDSVQSALDSI